MVLLLQGHGPPPGLAGALSRSSSSCLVPKMGLLPAAGCAEVSDVGDGDGDKPEAGDAADDAKHHEFRTTVVVIDRLLA